MNHFWIKLALAVFHTWSQPTWAAEPLSLTAIDLPALVRAKNQNVLGANFFTDSSAKLTGHLARSFFPRLSGEIGAESFKTGEHSFQSQPFGGIEASINLFHGGKDSLEESIRQTNARIAGSVAKQTFWTELREAKRLFWQTVFTQETLAVLKEALVRNENNLISANRRIERGVAARTDRIEFEINRSQLQEDIESLERESRILQLKLGAGLGLPLDTAIGTPVTVPHEHHDDDFGIKFNAANNQELNALTFAGEVSDLQRSTQARWWLPSIDAYSQYALYTNRDRDYTARSDRDDLAFGIRLKLAIFDGLESSTLASHFALQKMALEYQVFQRTRTMEAEFRSAQEEMKLNHDLIHQAEKRIQQGELYLAGTLEEYNRGVKNSPDVLSATERLTQFRKRYAEIKRDYQISRANLLTLAEVE